MFKNENLWANVGKIGALIGVILSLFGLYDWIFPSQPVVQARCVPMEINPVFSRPVDISKYSDDPFLKALPQDQFGHLQRLIDHGYSGTFDYLVSKRIDYVECEVRNYGKKSAKDVEIIFDGSVFSGFYDKNWIDLTVNHRMPIGSIKPSDSVKLYFLSSFPLGRYAQDRFGVKFEDGSGDVLFSEPSYGLSSYFFSEIQTVSGKILLSMVIFFFIFIFGFLLFIFSEIKKDKRFREMQLHANKLNDLIVRAEPLLKDVGKGVDKVS